MKSKRLIVFIISLSLLANLFFAIRLVQAEKNYNSNISAKQEEINELKKDKKRPRAFKPWVNFLYIYYL